MKKSLAISLSGWNDKYDLCQVGDGGLIVRLAAIPPVRQSADPAEENKLEFSSENLYNKNILKHSHILNILNHYLLFWKIPLNVL